MISTIAQHCEVLDGAALARVATVASVTDAGLGPVAEPVAAAVATVRGGQARGLRSTSTRKMVTMKIR